MTAPSLSSTSCRRGGPTPTSSASSSASAARCGCGRSLSFATGTAPRYLGVSRLEDGALMAIAGPDMVVLHTTADIHGEGLKTVGEFTVSAGERIPFVLTYGPSHLPPPDSVD